MLKKIITLVLAFSLIFTMSACGGGSKENSGQSEGEGEKIVLKAAHVLQDTHPYQMGFEKMNEVLQEKTNGQISIDIFPNSQLGGEDKAIEGLQMGVIDLTTISPAPLTGFVPEYLACDLPFLFDDIQTAYDFYDGSIGDELFAKTEGIGLIGLAWWDYGFRNFSNGKNVIKSPADMTGLKLRVQNAPVHIASLKALGANPVPMPFAEVYTALQQKVIDGWETPSPAMILGKYYEIQKYYSLSGHFYDSSPLYISAKTMDKLTPEQQEAVREAAIIGRDYMREQNNKMIEESIQQLKDFGMEVTPLTAEDKAAFKEAVKDVPAQFANEIGQEFLDKFLKAAGR